MKGTSSSGSPMSSASMFSTPPKDADEVDIVLSLSENGSKFLESWAPILQPYHIIIIQSGSDNSSAPPRIPPSLDAEWFSRSDAKRILGSRAGCISQRDSSSRCLGFLLSKKKFIVTLSDDCYVAHHPETGHEIDAVAKHISNLKNPSTPFFFNTLYDPYQEANDFVRGYPFSLREGAPTAISHGLWLNMADYDAPTQLVKPNERNMTYVNCVVTIPKGCFYAMSGLNLAFNKDLIGPAMYFPPVADGHALGFHDDLWAGWCSKVICDHLQIGVKSGLPYVWREKSTNAFLSLKREYKGLFWQEEIIPFFQSVRLPSTATTAAQCYVELAKQVKEKLGKSENVFLKLADAMLLWVEAWNEFHGPQ